MRGDDPVAGPWTDRLLGVAGALLLVAVLVLVGVEHYWLRDLKFDDAYIHFRYAENIARGKGFVYNDGERVLGSGAVPWNLLLAAIAGVTPPGTLPGAVSVLNYLFLLACAAVLLLGLWPLTRPGVALVIAAAMLVQGPLVVSSIGGMETTLLCLLYFLTFLALQRGRYALAGLCAGGSVCLRIDSAFLAGVALLAPLVYERRRFWRAFAATLALPLLVNLWAWWYFGSPLANSTIAKRIVYSPPPLYALRECLGALAEGVQFVRLWPSGQLPVAWAGDARVLLWLPFLCLGYLFVRRRAAAASLVVLQAVGALVFYAVADPPMFTWYLCTFVPLATLFALLGLVALGERLPVRPALGALPVVIAVVLLSVGPLLRTWWPLVPPSDPRFSFELPNAGGNARVYQYVNIARALDARAGPTDRLCTSEIGALGYYYRGKILDGIGLVSPEALRYQPVRMRRHSGVGAIPPEFVRDFAPEFVVSLDLFADALFADPWFQQHYALLGRWWWYGGPVRWHDLPPTVWTAYEVRAYQRVAGP